MSRTEVSPIPEGFNSLSPYIVCKGAAEAIEFYKKAFGAEEQFRLKGPNNSVVHCCLRIGDSSLMVTDECPQMGAFGPGHLGGTPVTILFSVEDADAAVSRAAAAGAAVVMPVTEMFWVARYGVLKDPFGHSWSVATQVKNLQPAEIQAAMEKQFCSDYAKSA